MLFGRRRVVAVRALFVGFVLLQAAASSAQLTIAPAKPATAKPAGSEAQWIWSPQHAPGQVPAGACYFRRTFLLQTPEDGKVTIAADDAYELFVNGRAVGTGQDWKAPATYDITRYLTEGANALAVKVENREGAAAGLVARVTVQQAGQTALSYSTDGRWKSTLKPPANWFKAGINDASWAAARSLGEIGVTAPWIPAKSAVAAAHGGRFKIDAEFRVEQVAGPELTGSLIAFAFNEWGDVLASQEGGPLLLIQDKDVNGSFEAVSTYCDKVKNCQGMLCLNGQVYAVADGPDGAALYRLEDKDADDVAEDVQTIVRFGKQMSEHGPHVPVLGPDGLIYVLLGNMSTLPEKISPASPYRNYYEGDLVQPRTEDPAGYSAGIKAPAGMVLRTDIDGQHVEIFAGGFRNAYDLAFNKQGDLFTVDSDNESDEGLPWFRPTRVTHVPAGGEFGWRSGWATWPDYYLDSTPPLLYTGRGSPSGIEFYNHHRYPASFQNAMFVGDWSRGRITVVKLEPSGGTYRAESETFLEGQPLNVTDLAVGRDGWLYFVTGGRGTEGGVYRVLYDGRLPAPPRPEGMQQALKQPQFYSAWSRERLAVVKEELGSRWDKELAVVLASPTATNDERTRALDLMQLVGPFPTSAQLLKLAAATSEQVRAKAAYLMGLHANEQIAVKLADLLADPDANVRRTACESLSRAGYAPSWEKLSPLLADKSRSVSYAARRLLMECPPEKWQAKALAHPQTPIFLQGAAALCALKPDKPATSEILARGGRLMRGYLSDDEFLSLLRVMQLALLANEQSEAELLVTRRQLAEEYPALEPRLNRELMRLLVYLQEPSMIQRLLDELKGEAPQSEKLHAALYVRRLKQGWTSSQKLALLEFYEQARASRGGVGLPKYVDTASRDFLPLLTPAEEKLVLMQGARFPSAALAALVKLPDQPGEAMLKQLEALDAELAKQDSDAARQLSIGIVAIMARDGTPRAFEFLRQVYERDPDRRASVAMGLAQQPGGANWPYLIRSLNVLDANAAQEVLAKLAEVDKKPADPEPLRQVILCGLKLGDEGGPLALALLEKWTGETAGDAQAKPAVRLASWQEWFRAKHPEHPDPSLPVEAAESKWTVDELMTYLNSSEGKQGRVTAGELVFAKALCAKCHRHSGKGEPVGPDLSTVARRFQKKEIVEAVLFPSHVISDQFASKTVVTKDGLSYSGLVGQLGQDALVVLDSTGKKTTVLRANVEEIVPQKKSAMPEGLFNNLTLEEIADLMAFLSNEAPNVAAKGATRK